MPSGSRFKHFGNGVVHAYNGEDFISKVQARKRAGELRSQGFFVRIVKTQGMYSIYTRRKGK